MKKILRLAVILTLIAAIAAFCLSLVYAATKDQIAKQEKEQEAKALQIAFPEVKKTSDFKEQKDLTEKLQKKNKEILKVFEVAGKGWCIQIGPRGYGGTITMVVGINSDGKVVGMSIVSQNETPGLGANIEQQEFQTQFKEKSASDSLEIGEDIDALTGATISSKAVTKGVKEALEAAKKL